MSNTERQHIVFYDRIYIPQQYVKPGAEKYFTYRIEEYEGVLTIRTYSKAKGYFIVPYGSWEKVQEFLTDKTIPIDDKLPDRSLLFPDHKITLWDDQEKVVNEFLSFPRKTGFIQSRPGSGKTVMACYILHTLAKRFLIIVPTSLLLEQWYDRLTTFIPGIKVGLLGNGQDSYMDDCHGLVAIVNSLNKRVKRFRDEAPFGTIIMDEAHRLPANTYKTTIDVIPATHKIGLSANTTRKDQKHVVIADFLGPYCVVNKNPNVLQAEIIVVNSGFNHVYTPQMRWAKFLNTVCLNEEYNRKIAQKVTQNVREGRKVAVLSPRLQQLEMLSNFLEGYSYGIITGSTSPEERNKIIDKVNNDEVDILLCSKQIFEEGVDIQRLDTIHLVAPSNNIEKLEQAIGRVERQHKNKKAPLVYDYWFMATTKNTLHKQQRERFSYYQERGYAISHETLF